MSDKLVSRSIIMENYSRYRPLPKKKYGQNFLKSRKIAEKMVNLLEIQKGDTIVEIGVGNSNLLDIILKRFENDEIKYIGYEIDDELFAGLRVQNRNFKLLNENFLDTNLDDLTDFKVIGSIPYNISSPIIHKLLKIKNRPSKIVLMVQKEFADKLLQKVPKANYFTYITLGYTIKKIENVKAEMFNPKPKVDSSIIVFTKNDFDISTLNKQNQEFDFNKWEKFLHHFFRNQRKMLHKAFDKSLLQEIGIDPTLRPAQIPVDSVIALFRRIN